MNDSGFWVVAKMGGFSEKETFIVWTLLAAIVGIAGFGVVLLLNLLLPLK